MNLLATDVHGSPFSQLTSMWEAIPFWLPAVVGLYLAFYIYRRGRARWYERKYPLSGTYLGHLCDEHSRVETVLRIAQRGGKLTLEQERSGRRWTFRGWLVSEGSAISGYYEEPDFDKPIWGAVFMWHGPDGAAQLPASFRAFLPENIGSDELIVRLTGVGQISLNNSGVFLFRAVGPSDPDNRP